MNLRTIATPLTIGSAILLCVTGCCLLLRLRGGLMDPLHEIASIFFLFGSALHLVVNKNATLAHLKRPIGALLASVFALLSVVALLSLSRGQDHFDPHFQARRSMEILLDAPLPDLARLTRRSESDLHRILSDRGLARIEPNATLGDLARTNGMDPREALAIVLR